MTELEFALSTLLAEGVAQGNTKQRWKLDVLGVDYKALRAMRFVCFLHGKDIVLLTMQGNYYSWMTSR
jgi:hypothetical protein